MFFDLVEKVFVIGIFICLVDFLERVVAVVVAIVLGCGSILWLHVIMVEVYVIILFGVMLLFWWFICGVIEGLF